MSPQVAWCLPSGLIKITDKEPPENGPALAIAIGPRCDLRGALEAFTGCGKDDELRIPALSQAQTKLAAVDTLNAWLVTCARVNRLITNSRIEFREPLGEHDETPR